MEAAAIYTGEVKTLADRVNAYLDATHGSIASLAKEISYSRTATSRYLSGKYESAATGIEEKLEAWLKEHAGDGKVLHIAPPQTGGANRPEFFESRDAKNILGVCSSCQEFMGLGIVVGKSGYGKTHALKYYAKMPRVAYVECDDTMASRDLVEAIERVLGIPAGYGTIWKRVNSIREFFNVNKGYLLVIDEADKLISKYTQKKMEILRAIYDQSDVGLVIAGEPRLEAQIKSYLPRMANRMDFYVNLGGLNGKEVEGLLDGFDIDPDALAELKARACNTQTGCFRLFDRTLKNVFRILEGRNDRHVTLEVINQASRMMML